MTNEPLLDEIRRVRHEISAEIGHDPHRVVEYYSKLQQSLRERVVNLSGEVAAERDESGREAVGVSSQPAQ